jgi:hypothetical protein
MLRFLHNPLFVLLILTAIDGLMLGATRRQLPPSVASHFDIRGNADGWSDTETFVLVFAVLSLGLPLMMVGIFRLTRYLPPSLINLPNRDYWLAPERREETYSVLLRQSLWLACLVQVYVMGLYLLALEANFHDPAQLSVPAMLGLLAGFLLGVAYWVVLLYRRFRKVE